MQPRKIIAADDERDMRDFYQKMLPALGHEVLYVAGSGDELISACENRTPDLIITDIRMPGMDGIDAATHLWQRYKVPVLLVSAYHDYELLKRAEGDAVFGYLVKPIEEVDLETAICVAVHRFEQMQQVQGEAEQLRQALADRKLIERAKGIVMKRTGLGEAEAFRKLQKLSWDRNQKLAQVARIIIEGDELMTTVV
jgi:two-component system, response regulator PdtaR